ncbi:MAG: hypothetical protein KGH98_01680 [Candidatus Micrarchaeota archaeon]|nr:hypothetical protein [Candidatus Micrarchaeota archaeon]
MSETIFFVLALAEIIALLLVYVFRDIVDVVVSLSAAFFINSLIFLALNQPLLAAIQMFIMIGGISTYLFVGVATEGYLAKLMTSKALFIAVFAMMFVLLSYPLLSMGAAETEPAQITGQQVGSQIGASVFYFYIMALLAFGATVGAIILLRSGGKR